MRRRLLQLLTALSLLLALATAGWWGRSYTIPDHLGYERFEIEREDYRRTGVSIVSVWATLQTSTDRSVWRQRSVEEIGSLRSGFFRRGFGDTARKGMLRGPEGTFKSRWGFGTFTHDMDNGGVAWHRPEVTLPHWFLVLLFSLLPAVRVIRWQVRRRRARQLGPDARPCPSCGYDRRATPTRCPECGHAELPPTTESLPTGR
jgi:hypothetical protein